MITRVAIDWIKQPFKNFIDIKNSIYELNKKLEVNNKVLKDVLWALISECMTEEEIKELATKIKQMH